MHQARSLISVTYNTLPGDIGIRSRCLSAQQSQPRLSLFSRLSNLSSAIGFVSSHTGFLGLRLTHHPSSTRRCPWPESPSTAAARLRQACRYCATRRNARPRVKVNGSCPKLTATNFSRGMGRPAQEAAVNIVRLATLGVVRSLGYFQMRMGLLCGRVQGKLPFITLGPLASIPKTIISGDLCSVIWFRRPPFLASK